MTNVKHKGFSLVELIVVIAIMAILVAVMAPSLMIQIRKSRYSKDKSVVDTVASAVVNGIAEEESYDDMMKVADHLPFDIYLSEIYDLSNDDVERQSGDHPGRGRISAIDLTGQRRPASCAKIGIQKGY